MLIKLTLRWPQQSINAEIRRYCIVVKTESGNKLHKIKSCKRGNASDHLSYQQTKGHFSFSAKYIEFRYIVRFQLQK